MPLLTNLLFSSLFFEKTRLFLPQINHKIRVKLRLILGFFVCGKSGFVFPNTIFVSLVLDFGISRFGFSDYIGTSGSAFICIYFPIFCDINKVYEADFFRIVTLGGDSGGTEKQVSCKLLFIKQLVILVRLPSAPRNN